VSSINLLTYHALRPINIDDRTNYSAALITTPACCAVLRGSELSQRRI